MTFRRSFMSILSTKEVQSPHTESTPGETTYLRLRTRTSLILVINITSHITTQNVDHRAKSGRGRSSDQLNLSSTSFVLQLVSLGTSLVLVDNGTCSVVSTEISLEETFVTAIQLFPTSTAPTESGVVRYTCNRSTIPWPQIMTTYTSESRRLCRKDEPLVSICNSEP